MPTKTWFDDVTAELQAVQGKPHPMELNPIQKNPFRFTWQDWWGEKAGWQPKNYGRWRMTNPGLMERFDVTVLFPRQHRGQTATLKFIWQGKTIERKLDKIPESVKLDNVELGEGTGFMEAQLHIDGKMWGVQEVQIEVAKK